MANEIYSSSWWGVGPCNDVGWGIVYKQYANCGVVPGIIADFTARVIADGGTVESEACLDVPLTFLTDNPIPSAYDYLLDDYSGAAAAYSLRQLSSTYSGDAIRVRRSSDNTEQNIGFVSNELDTASLETFCSGTDGFVAIWYDQSGSANNAANATAANQPKIVSSGSTLLRGGKPSMQFDGNDDYFNTSQNNPFTFTGGVSMIHASYKNANAYKQYETILSANGAENGTAVKMALGYSSATAVNPTPTIATDIWQPSGIQYDGTVGTNERQLIGFYFSNWSTHRSTGLSNLRLNGSDLTTKPYYDVNPTALGTNPIKIGVFDEILGNSMFGGEIQEIIAYASDKNSDRVGIETNINDHYSIY